MQTVRRFLFNDTNGRIILGGQCVCQRADWCADGVLGFATVVIGQDVVRDGSDEFIRGGDVIPDKQRLKRAQHDLLRQVFRVLQTGAPFQREAV